MTTTIPLQIASSLLAGPAGTPPPGVVPDLTDAPSIQVEGRALLTLGLVLMLIPLAVRLFTQWVIGKSYVLEDFLIILAAASTGGQVACEYVVLTPGHSSGYHMWDRTLAEFLEGQKYVNLIAILYTPALALIKIAILIQLRKIFAPTRRTNPWLWFGCWAWIFITPLYYLIEMLLYIFQCTPRHKIWDPFIAGRCIPGSKQLFLASAFFNVISDVLILALPLPAIWRLNMKLKKKFLVGGLFATALLACAASAIRLYYSFIIIYHPDVSWNYVALGTAALFEEVIGFIVFCLPVMPKFVHFLRDKFYGMVPNFRNASYASSRNPGLRSAWPDEAHGVPKHVVPDTTLGVSSVRQYLGPGKRSMGSSTVRLHVTSDEFGTEAVPSPSGESLEMESIAMEVHKAPCTLRP